ncbi:MAG TPA: hypothetical protein VFS67_23590 [Polyangiaceae bacterium]|nr:hypothetical protein [Polyangiaceae bacterium]
MTSRREFLRLSASAAFTLGFPLGTASAQAQTLALVVAKNSPIQQLSQYELKKLYLGANINDPSGERIIAFNQAPNSPDRVAFEQRVLGMSSEEVSRYWIDRKIRGESGAPKAVGSVELLQRVVSKLEHSVAYVRADQVRPEVRIVAIDGSVPGDSGYRLYA